MDHDSYDTDTYNQAVGRDIATRHGGEDLIVACTQAYLSGRLMVGPAATPCGFRGCRPGIGRP